MKFSTANCGLYASVFARTYNWTLRDELTKTSWLLRIIRNISLKLQITHYFLDVFEGLVVRAKKLRIVRASFIWHVVFAPLVIVATVMKQRQPQSVTKALFSLLDSYPTRTGYVTNLSRTNSHNNNILYCTLLNLGQQGRERREEDRPSEKAPSVSTH